MLLLKWIYYVLRSFVDYCGKENKSCFAVYIQYVCYGYKCIPIVHTSNSIFYRLCGQITIWEKRVLFEELEPLTMNMPPIMSYWVFCYHFKWTRSANKTLCVSRGSPSHAALNEIRSAFIKGISAKGTWLASFTYSTSLGGNVILLVKRSQFSDKKPMPSQA